MAEAAKKKKKVVRVEPTATKSTKPTKKSDWKPTPESKAKATKFRVIAWILWAIAIGVEAYAIFVLLKQDPINMVFLIGALVVTAIFAIIGSQLWKKANDADPASETEKFRFFVQNQLGVFISIIAFLPLILLILTNKDMDSKQKGIAGGAAAVLLVVAALFSADFSPSSTEQYGDESAIVIELTGADLVFWTKSGEVYHLCEDVSAVNLESEDNQIYSGTVGDAHASGKERLTKQVQQELDQCGYDVEYIEGETGNANGVEDDTMEAPSEDDATVDETVVEEEPADA